MGWRVTTIQEIKDYLESDGVMTLVNQTPDLKKAYEVYQAEMNKIPDKHREMQSTDEGILQALTALQHHLENKHILNVDVKKAHSAIKENDLLPEERDRKRNAAAMFNQAQGIVQVGDVKQFIRSALRGVDTIQVAEPVPEEDQLKASVRADDSTIKMTEAFDRHRRVEEKIKPTRENQDVIASKEEITEAVLPGKKRDRDAANAFMQKIADFDLKKLITYRAQFYHKVLGDLIKELEGKNQGEYRYNSRFIEAKNALVNDPVFSVMQTFIREKAIQENKTVPIFEAEKAKPAPEAAPRGRSGMRGVIDRIRRSPSPESRKVNKGGLDIVIPNEKPRGPGRGK